MMVHGRKFPLEQWASKEGLRPSTTEPTRTSNEHGGTSEEAQPSRFRDRLRSFPLLDPPDLSRLNIHDKSPTRDQIKMKGGFRSLIRRASNSLKRRERRHTNTAQDRPQTAWPHFSLRHTASFSYQSSDLDILEDSHEQLTSPVPGSSKFPPIIPRGSGGAAARATAAAQNEYFGRISRPLDLVVTEEVQGDRESGIGIAAISAPQPPAFYSQDESIPRVDFISRLPVELAIQVLSRVGLAGLRHVMFVSRRWNEISRSPHVWRETYMREQTNSFAISTPLLPGAGLGLPPLTPDLDWKNLYRVKQKLERNWREGNVDLVYLNGHLDSIYCVQFDE